jgi:hypothetical protein
MPLLALAAAIVWLLPTVEQITGIDCTGPKIKIDWLHWSLRPGWSLAIGAALFVSVLGILAVGRSSEFLYFQF